MALTTLAAIVYVAMAEKTYEAESRVLVTPVTDQPVYRGLGLIMQSSDPTRDVQTAAKLITTTAVAERVKRVLGSDEPPTDLLGDGDRGAGGAEPARRRHRRGVGTRRRRPTSRTPSRPQAVTDRSEQFHERVDRADPGHRGPVRREQHRHPRPRGLQRLAESSELQVFETRPTSPTQPASPTPQAEPRRRLRRRHHPRHRRSPSPGRRSTRACAARSSCAAATGCRSSAACRSSRAAPARPGRWRRRISPAATEAFRTLRGTSRPAASAGRHTGRSWSPGRRRRRARPRPRSTSPRRSPPAARA